MNEFCRCQTALGKLVARKDGPMASSAAGRHAPFYFQPPPAPPAFVVIADNIQAQTDRFCLLDPVPTGSGPFFYRLGVK
jgi:hypothetical protein